MSPVNRYRGNFRRIVNGEPVRDSIANRPPEDLLNDIQYLKARLDQIVAGQALILTDQTLGEDLQVGTPVYIDSSGVWQAGKAEVEVTATSTIFQLTDKALVQGMVSTKAGPTTADITIYGSFEADANILNIVEGTYTPGLFYLSAFEAGYITASKGAVPVRVAVITGPDASGNYQVLVTPDVRETAESHGHYRVELSAQPAGTASCMPAKPNELVWGDFETGGPYPGTVHTITEPDPTQQGWLPATSTYFPNQEIPTGAKFGYNMTKDTDLDPLWPPIPLSQVYLEVDGAGAGDLVEVNKDGIWWMDDTYGHAPWDVNIQPCDTSSSSSSSSGVPDLTPSIVVWFTRPVFGSVYENLQDFVNSQIVWNGLPPQASELVAATLPATAPALYGYTLPSAVATKRVWYVLPVREFEPLQPLRSVRLKFEVLLANDSSSPSDAPSTVLSKLTLKISRLQLPLDRAYKDFNQADGEADTIYPVTPGWDVYPADDTDKPDTYYKAVTTALTANSGETLYVMLEWAGGTTNDIYYLGLRPVVELVEDAS
jgi:hypothetical protein